MTGSVVPRAAQDKSRLNKAAKLRREIIEMVFKVDERNLSAGFQKENPHFSHIHSKPEAPGQPFNVCAS